MTQILSLPFSSNASFPGCRYIGANGIFETGPELPTGIPDRVWIDNGAVRLYLNTDDVSTAGWKRTELDFGEFDSTFGEKWTSFDFKYDWSFSNYIVIGSWAVMIDYVSGTTYVPIGFRIRNHCLVIQAPLDLNTIGFNNQDLSVTPIEPNTWYQVVTHVNLQSDGTGFREMFLNGVPLFRQWNVQTTYPGATSHYFKGGPYDGLHTAEFQEATLYLRNVSMWSGREGYPAVMGTVPIAPKQLLKA